MKTADRLWLAGLLLLGGFIWWRDRAWLAAPDDALPLLAAIPLFVWLGAPWRFVEGAFRLQGRWLAVAGVLLAAGLVTSLNVLLALALTAGLWSWLAVRLAPEEQPRIVRLLPLVALAFPWLTLDLPSLGWGYRLTAAWTAEHVFQWLDLSVQREGTQLLVQQMPFDVSPACSGIKALQAMLVGGMAVCFMQIRRPAAYWSGLACLPLLAWLVNVLRVLLVVASGLTFGAEFAAGWFHPVSGWLVIVLVFGALWGVLQWLHNRQNRHLHGGATP
jgi:exosortase/archaeosortase family protein